MGRLVSEGSLVEAVSEEAERENGRCEGIAGCLGPATEEPSQDLVAVFCGGGLARDKYSPPQWFGHRVEKCWKRVQSHLALQQYCTIGCQQ